MPVAVRLPSGRRAAVLAGIVFIAGAIVGEQTRLITSLLSRYTNEDHTLLWLAATDWWRLRMREPTFYGQPYGATFESIPAGLLHVLGISYGIALPVTLLALAVSAWWLLAWGAWKRGFILPALIALTAPILLSIDHWIVVGVIGTGVGRFLTALAGALCLGARSTPRVIGAAVGLAGFGVAIDTAAALIAAPVMVWAAWDWLRVRRAWLAILSGLLFPLAWIALNSWFNSMFPDHALHPGPGFSPQWDVLRNNFDNLDRLFAPHAAEVYPHGGLVPWLCSLALLAGLATRSWRAAGASACYIALLLLLAALPKSLDTMDSLWFPAARMTLAAPMGLWFVCAVTMGAIAERLAPRLRERLAWGAFGALTLLCVGTASWRDVNWDDRIGLIERAGLAERRLPLRMITDIEDICRAASEAAGAAETPIVIFPHDRAANYACPALYPRLISAHPSYERRYWILRRLSSRPSERMLIWGAAPDLCGTKKWKDNVAACSAVVDGRAVRVDFPSQPPLDVLHRLGYSPRPFGADCHPNERQTCAWWARKYGG
jgi:hypothetical protein